MLKVVMILISTTMLFADYYSTIDTQLRGEKKIKFNKGLAINVSQDNMIALKSKIDFHWIDDGEDAKIFDPINLDKKIYPVYNLRYLLKNSVSYQEFLLKTKAGYLLVRSKIKDTNIDTPLYGYINVQRYSYKVEKAFDNQFKKANISEDDILVKYVDGVGNIVAIELMDEGAQKVVKCITPALKRFLQEKKTRKVTVEKFDFSKEKLYLTYVSKHDSSVKRMKLEYSMKKKYIKVVLKTPISIFDPEYKDSTQSIEVGILREANQDLYEIKKVEIINGSEEIAWLNYPKKSVVLVDYNNQGYKDRKVLSKTKGQQFYSIEGLLYLVSWMDKNGKDKKIFTFMNGTLPFDATMKEQENHNYIMEKSSKVIYRFELDKRHFLQKITYPAYDITIKLENVDSDTTLKNKEYLHSFMQEHYIKLIKE